MEPSKGKHRHSYRILVIPDDKDEPKAFSVSLQRLRLLKVLAVVLALHMIVGLVFYYQSYRLYKQNATLSEVNRHLEENNLRINKLYADFQNLEAHQEKIRKALGLGNIGSGRPTSDIIIPEELSQVTFQTTNYADTRPERRREASDELRDRMIFLKSTANPLHDLYANVPTLLPVDGILSADYENRSNAPPQQHRGIDIAADMGKIIRASADGVVLFAGFTWDLGNMMIIYHGGGFYTYYGHAQQLLLTRGSMVKKGEAIGLVGNTGLSSAPHLHFEIWQNGISLDPKEYILELSQM